VGDRINSQIERENAVEQQCTEFGTSQLTKGDDINHPVHYTAGKVECIDAIEAALTPEEYRGYLKGNILKYTWRERQKEGDKAMGKARWYLDRLLGVRS
jgi:hypothetical protein